jgi:hypothetical protein
MWMIPRGMRLVLAPLSDDAVEKFLFVLLDSMSSVSAFRLASTICLTLF